MFLSMMTADAAAVHGHEFSPQKDSSPSKGSPVRTRSPLSILATAAARPQRPAVTPLPLDGNLTTKSRRSIMFAEPEARSDISRPTSPSDVVSLEEKPKKKRTPRAKSTYNLAHPPPVARPRHIRPKVLLQLQHVSAFSRPKPAFEVLPASKFVPRLAITKKFLGVFKGGDKLGLDDVLVVKAQDYGPADEEDSSDDDSLASREVVGVICAGRKDDQRGSTKSQIYMDDGSVWEATSLQNGGYEFVFTDEHGLQLKARWVARGRPARRSSGSFDGRGAAIGASHDDKKFNFSTISPDSRRHPIIATMTRSSIDILDHYTMPSASSTPYSPTSTPLQTPSVCSDAGSYMEAAEPTPEHGPVRTDESLHKLILVTGIWVAFHESWSSVFRYSRTALGTSSGANNAVRPYPPQRVVSMPIIDVPSGGFGFPVDWDARRSNFPKILRNNANILQRNNTTRSTSSSAATPPNAAIKTRSRRSNSTGMALGSRNRAASISPFGLLGDQTLAESDNERSGRSSQSLHHEPVTVQSPVAATPTKKTLPPPILIASPTPEGTPAHTPSPSKTEKPNRTQSAYYPSTANTSSVGLWDSGEPPSPSPICKSKKTRPKSVDAATLKVKAKEKNGDEVKEKRREGRFRRMFGLFRRGNGG